jgi:hypothetical protein
MTTSVDTGHTSPEASPPAQPRTAGGRQLAALAVAGVLVGAAAVVGLLASLRNTAPAAAASGGAAAAPAARAAAAPATGGTPAPEAPGDWNVTSTRARRNPLVTFELISDNDVGLIDRRLRPILVLRCSTALEAFVITGGAAAIEGNDHRHTVAIGFDGAPPATAQWLDSEERDALFAPDPASFARQVAGAKTMRFEFVPFGAPRAAAEFNVRGFADLSAKMPKACRN